MSKIYIASALSQRLDEGGTRVSTEPYFIIAKNIDTATGMAYRKAETTYPSEDGWTAPRITIAEATESILASIKKHGL